MTSFEDIFIRTDSYSELINQLVRKGIYLGVKIIVCIVVYYVGNKMAHYVNHLLSKAINHRKLDSSVSSFLKSLANILLTVSLLFLIVNILGFNNSSFVALLASIGVALGMALSGTLQNFSGGVIILLFRPYKVGDYIAAQGQEGKVKEIQIFNTLIVTSDNRTVFIPNGGLSTNVIVNYSNQEKRRVDWTFSVAYGISYDKVKQLILDILAAESRILYHPGPSVFLKKISDNSVDIGIYAWLKSDDYTSVYFDINEAIYKQFDTHQIEIPFPQITVYQVKEKNNKR